LEALAELFSREYGWDIGPANIALTNGSQSAFFMLFNLFAGKYSDGREGKVLFPLVPEYVGYADQSRFSADFSVCLPRVEERGPHRFKYRVDFDRLTLGDTTAALCASRPTNPTGNVLTDDEVGRLTDLAAERGIPFMLDGAYGLPFPSIIFTEARPVWNQNIVLCMSLSKIGLPSLRTGIVIAKREVIEALSAMNTILSLANGSLGPEIMLPFVRSGEVLRISRDLVRPFYQRRSLSTQAYIDICFAGSGVDYSIHESEGAIFLWIWFKNLPITTMELYERLKARRVFVIPGRYFFFGEAENWAHRDECLRLNYSQDEADVRRGIEIMAEEAALATSKAARAMKT
jgi:valine--pyruvate aminotransferase